MYAKHSRGCLVRLRVRARVRVRVTEKELVLW